MLTGQIRSKVDQVWNAFWSGGVSNPLSVTEQITYLLFIKRLDELQTLTRPIPFASHWQGPYFQKNATHTGGHTRTFAGRGSRTSRRGR